MCHIRPTVGQDPPGIFISAVGSSFGASLPIAKVVKWQKLCNVKSCQMAHGMSTYVVDDTLGAVCTSEGHENTDFVSKLTVRLEGFGFRVSVVGFRFSVSGFQVPGFGCRVHGSGVRLRAQVIPPRNPSQAAVYPSVPRPTVERTWQT